MYTQALPKELQEKAKKELNEIPSQITENLEYIREWLGKQPHLNARTDDLWLLNFLRGCKFSLQRTKEKLDFFYSSRTLTPELFGNRDVFSTEVQKVLKRGIFVFINSFEIPYLMVRWKNSDPTEVQLETLLKVGFMIFDIFLQENNFFMITGVDIIHDLDDFPVNYLQQFTPAFCKKMLTMIQKAYPLRLKGINVVNSMAYFEIVFNLCKPFMSKKLRDRVFFHKEFTSVHQRIPKSTFPREYGGNGSSVGELTADLKNLVESYHDWFLEDVQYCSDERKRPEKSKTAADIYGIEGSFRNLGVD